MYFSSSNYGCAKNPRKFLFLKWFGFHDLEIFKISYWAFGKWAAEVRCTQCGITDRTFGISEAELAVTRMKVTKDVIENHRDLLLREG